MNTNERAKKALLNEAHKNGYTYIVQFNDNVIEYIISKVKRTLNNDFYTEEDRNIIIDNVMSEKVTILDEIFNPCQM